MLLQFKTDLMPFKNVPFFFLASLREVAKQLGVDGVLADLAARDVGGAGARGNEAAIGAGFHPLFGNG
jgi:hypothetical protein